MKRNLIATAVGALLLMAVTAYAHHSLGATYDGSKEVIAERNGDGAVRRYTYDATGSLLTVSQDISTQLTGSGGT